MASINDLAAAATIASSAVALQSPKEETAQPASPSSPHDPLSPPSPSPSAQLQAQAQEAHAQKINSASKSPVPETVAQEPDPDPDPAPIMPDVAHTTVSSERDSSSITVNAGVSVDAPSPLAPSSATPQLSPETPARGTVPKESTDAESAPVKREVTPETDDVMDGVEYETEQRKPPVRGAFLVFEGMDRAGKTTQAKLLQLRCIESGRQVKFMRFPGKFHVSYSRSTL